MDQPKTNKIFDEKVDKTYQAVFLENDYLKIMILPELGGRVHRAYEKAHGLPGWIDAVDNERSLITITLFGGFDPALTNDFKLKGRLAA